MVNTDVAVAILQRGHWRISVRPRQYASERVAFARLDTALANSVVQRRGWPVPFIDNREQIRSGHNWIGQEIDGRTVGHFEAWRFFQSGQMTHLRAVSAEWRDDGASVRAPAGFQAIIEVWEILFYLTEVFELAGRLGIEVSSDAMTLDIELKLRPDTALVTGFGDLVPLSPRLVPHNLPSRTITLPTDKLVAEYGPAAAEASMYFFERSQWAPSMQQLQVLQRQLYS